MMVAEALMTNGPMGLGHCGTGDVAPLVRRHVADVYRFAAHGEASGLELGSSHSGTVYLAGLTRSPSIQVGANTGTLNVHITSP